MISLQKNSHTPFLALLCIVLFLIGCARDSLFLHNMDEKKAIEQATSQPLDVYLFRAGERLKITVFGEPDLSGDYDVDEAGSIVMPFVGRVKVAGQSGDEVENILRRAFADGYLRNPQISVEVAEFLPVYVLGAVATPNGFDYRDGLTVAAVIALSGGFRPRAERQDFEMLRKEKEGDGYRKMMGSIETALFPGDIIYVRERGL